MTASRLLRPGNYLPDFLPPECPLKIRVGANSPSLCPTMSSVTYSFMNCRPLWTRKVWPTNSGTMVQSRDHVFIGSRFLARSFFSTLARSRSSTCGPFFNDRLMFDYLSAVGETGIIVARRSLSSPPSTPRPLSHEGEEEFRLPLPPRGRGAGV